MLYNINNFVLISNCINLHLHHTYVLHLVSMSLSIPHTTLVNQFVKHLFVPIYINQYLTTFTVILIDLYLYIYINYS